LVQIAQKFAHFLETYRRPDGGRWGGQDLHDATGGVVTRSYVSSLRKGRIENPGFEKLRAIAKAMGFPPELWFEEGVGDGAAVEPPQVSRDIAGRLEHLFKVVKKGRTGEPYSNEDVARLSAGDLSEEQIKGIRNGRIADPSVSQVAALADVFGVRPSYFLDREEEPSLLDEEVVEALRDEMAGAILREVIRLPARERKIVLGIVRQFAGQEDTSDVL
jgi:transcriptional regulator with XRE-family HTH domain